MKRMSRLQKYSRLARLLVLAIGLALAGDAGQAAQRANQLYYNQDETDFFWTTEIPAGQAGETIDRYVDQIADAGVTVFLCNINSRRVNYRSQVWDAYWDGYDRSGPDDQPFLSPIPPAERAGFRKGANNMLQVHQEGVDYPARVIARCRQRNMSPWISIRMNDCHENDKPAHPFHGRFWVKHPEFRRQNCTGYFATCLDYARPEVRDFFMALIEEALNRYDVDGLELDFMREPYLFSAGKETEGTAILTGWLREVRQRINQAATRRGHPVRLGVRVPSRPDTARAMGLDAITWAREGLIELLVATPRWATLEFGMVIPEWRQQLGKSKVTLVGGLEILYRPMPGGPAVGVSPELARGAASLVLADGADAVYLFNYFPPTMPPAIYQSTLRSMTSLSSLRELPRTIAVTYRDIIAPGETYQAPLPAKGTQAVFTMKLGPRPPDNWHRELVVGLASNTNSPRSTPSVSFDGLACEFIASVPGRQGLDLLSFRIPAAAVKEAPSHEIKVVSKEADPFTIEQLEVRLRP